MNVKIPGQKRKIKGGGNQISKEGFYTHGGVRSNR